MFGLYQGINDNDHFAEEMAEGLDKCDPFITRRISLFHGILIAEFFYHRRYVFDLRS
jgi:hypothetical protein